MREVGGVDPELAALTAAAATTLVQRLTTEGWEQAKTAVGALWRQVHPERVDTVEAELVEARTTVLAARQAGDDQAEQDLTGEWHSRFRRLVAADPTAVDGLRRLIEELRFSMPGGGDTQIGRVDMRGHAAGHGRINMAARDIHITES